MSLPDHTVAPSDTIVGQTAYVTRVSNVGQKQPELLRSTGLRKQIATVSQTVNLRDNELDILAKFTGHNISH